jgi:hypothetical protein
LLYIINNGIDPEKSNAYAKSKICAEKAAWKFVEEKMKSNQKCFELAVINPCFILGLFLVFFLVI